MRPEQTDSKLSIAHYHYDLELSKTIASISFKSTACQQNLKLVKVKQRVAYVSHRLQYSFVFVTQK